ncbi:hypothetical protein DYI24_09530 [Rhodopseudomonas sp. BR0C11]|uniref:hypothetical protein n=1 Tax=Rhodopseudomonas sp. BR0C11 TaxID=2269370 RepID=UPI0013DF222A|nr:hypothetical protein [Rhodopseudomonas sp. BR0C11]NEV77282.1 hypothetical protein [Rhodopseudomonas sp. BR0C11]
MTDVTSVHPLMCRLSAEAIARARQLYEQTDEPLTSVATKFEISRHTLSRLAVREGWTPRSSRPRVSPRPKPPGRQPRGYATEMLAELRRRYVDTDEPVARIADQIGVHRDTVELLARKQGWPLRKNRPPRELPVTLQMSVDATATLQQARAADIAAAAAPAAPATLSESVPVVPESDQIEPPLGPPPDPALLALRLELAVAQQLRKVEDLREDAGADPASRAVEAERIARTLAALTQTLFKVRQLRDPERALSAADDEMPADADGFRLELARRIETFVGGGTDRALPAPGQPAYVGPVAG